MCEAHAHYIPPDIDHCAAHVPTAGERQKQAPSAGERQKQAPSASLPAPARFIPTHAPQRGNPA